MSYQCESNPEPADFLFPVQVKGTSGNKSIRYRDHDRDQIEISRGMFYDYTANTEIPVFYVKAMDEHGNDFETVRVPVEVLLEMLDQIGIRVFENS